MTYREFYKRHLPHWQPADAPLFITFVLKGSLPRSVLDLLDDHPGKPFEEWDEAIDQNQTPPRWLAIPDVAEIVSEALHHRDGKVYDLLAYCIMPTHVHLVCKIFNQVEGDDPIPLQVVMQSLKRHTALHANRILGRQGAFWHEESYDHVARSWEELERIIWYVITNPVKAGLVENWQDWKWTYVKHKPE
ncbi:MAG TPA: hypothetical protein VIO61_01795 [Anaerolineaceae bacterium]